MALTPGLMLPDLACDHPTPIRPNIEPDTDIQRELRDYAWTKIADYVAEHGDPEAIAIVLVGKDGTAAPTTAYSWAVNDGNASRLHTCSVASAVLLKRGLGI